MPKLRAMPIATSQHLMNYVGSCARLRQFRESPSGDCGREANDDAVPLLYVAAHYGNNKLTIDMNRIEFLSRLADHWSGSRIRAVRCLWACRGFAETPAGFIFAVASAAILGRGLSRAKCY